MRPWPLLLGLPLSLSAQTSLATRAAPPPLEFLGFQAGAHLTSVGDQVLRLGEVPLRCKRAKADSTVSECRTGFSDPITGVPVQLWLSAIDSLSGVLTISGPVSAEQLGKWRMSLERAYGQVLAVAQGPQWMMQWVRRGRMIRLTWRIQGGEKIASVSLVDGKVLDSWGRRRNSSPLLRNTAKPAAAAPSKSTS